MRDQSNTAIGTFGGTVFTILANITSGELIKTAILAAVGAIISFALSMLLKRWTRPPKSK